MRIAVLHASLPPSQGSPPNSNSRTPHLREEAQENTAKEIPPTTSQGVRPVGCIQPERKVAERAFEVLCRHQLPCYSLDTMDTVEQKKNI